MSHPAESARRSRSAPLPTDLSGTRSIELRTPAKLNLGLRVVGVRDDGYHLLDSLFAPIEIWDRIALEILPGAHQIELEVSTEAGDALPPALSGVTSGPDNLVFRAAEAFCRETGFAARIRIHLHKAIPAAAGLGGGSSDAAAVLNGLAQLCEGEGGPPLDLPVLARLALGLGADVPFFLDPRPSHVTGIGERITPVEGLPSSSLVVANPGISLDTAQVYRATDALGGALTDPGAGSTMRAFSRLSVENGDPRDGSHPGSESAIEAESTPGAGWAARLRPLWADLLINDLEPAARRLCPPIGRLVSAMHDAGAIGAGMTGSGATVFGVFDSNEAARKAADWLSRAPSGETTDAAWVQVSRLMGRN